MTTSKENDGYPNTSWRALVGPNYPEAPEILLGTGETVSEVVLRVGPRCGTVAGAVFDASTGKPVLDAWAKFTREDDPEQWLSFATNENGRFRVVLPDVPYVLEVTAPHFKTWRSEDDIEQVPTQRIRVSRGVVLGLRIPLEPRTPIGGSSRNDFRPDAGVR